MTSSNFSREQMRALCGEIHEDDGVDPRQFFRKQTVRQRDDRKSRQLCRQVAETLQLVLGGDTHDDVLQSLQVVDVKPAPNASRLLVTVRAEQSVRPDDAASLLGRLNEHVGRLRSEIAASIHRKRVPTLVFQITPSEEVAPGRDTEEAS